MAMVCCLARASLAAGPAAAQERTQLRIAWSICVGWMPWGWAADAGIVPKAASSLEARRRALRRPLCRRAM